MKIDNKKKKIIIIAAVIILVAAIATTVGVLCSKKAKQSENTESQTVTVDVTDENGEMDLNIDAFEAEYIDNTDNSDAIAAAAAAAAGVQDAQATEVK